MANIKEVARAAGVSPITVSRVLNEPETVSLATRSKVEAAITSLNYVPNIVGQALRHKKTNTIALVISDIRNPFYVPMIRAVEAVASAHGYDVLLANTEASAETEMRQLRALVGRRVDGVVLAPVYNTPDSVSFLQSHNVPATVVDYQMPQNDVNVVRCDTRTATTMLTQHLIDLGHCRLAMITGPQGIVTAQDRAEGYRDALRRAGLSIQDNPVHFGEFDPRSGHHLATKVLSADGRPTALVTASNFIAIGATHAARELGLRVPEDLSIVTFDAPRSELVLDPFFTSVVQPAFEIAEVATNLLFEELSGQGVRIHREVILPTTLEVNSSTSAPVNGLARDVLPTNQEPFPA